ncbi:hypothetical protein Pmani_032129 [Petrolisthes manimaculis]|uniref:Uncharacterized protein n=1 Tax=Petrolisthes manimaculis TaxID=1843537 RepID=A0AAE1NUA6_9EUCA|nr:hypothetical protein Pmani_032129 [Petrolisthes manimaculis]
MTYFTSIVHRLSRNPTFGTKGQCVMAPGNRVIVVKAREGVPACSPPHNQNKPQGHNTKGVSTTCCSGGMVVVEVVVSSCPQLPRLFPTTTRRLVSVLLTLVVLGVQLPEVSCHLAERKPPSTREKRELINDDTVSAIITKLLLF